MLKVYRAERTLPAVFDDKLAVVWSIVERAVSCHLSAPAELQGHKATQNHSSSVEMPYFILLFFTLCRAF